MTRETRSDNVRLPELMAAMSLATDLAMSFPPETALRTCLLGVLVGRELGLTEQELADVFYVTLLRHLGCTSLSHEEGAFVDDDNAWRRDFTGIDYTHQLSSMRKAVVKIGAGRGPVGRVRAIAAAASSGFTMTKVATAHCDAGRLLARRLGMSEGVVQGLDHVFERWDGKGWPAGVKGEAISPAARVTQFSHTVVLELWRRGSVAARLLARHQSGTEFDPGVAEAFLGRSDELLDPITAESVWDQVLNAEPDAGPWLPASRVDEVARVFGDFVDLKSPFTLGHSKAVADLASAAAARIGVEQAEVVAIRRAGLLHSLGRLAIGNGILDKAGPLTVAEWERLRLYPYHTERLLNRPLVLRPLAPLAGAVQERLDGSGYHRELQGPMLSIAARMLAAADVYEAMIEERPHRPALTADAAASAVAAECTSGRLDPEAVDCVLQTAGHSRPKAGRSWPAQLTDREVEVLRRVAQAQPNKAIARDLGISQETVRNHVRHIYEKTGVQSRAGAALFAMEHDLLHR